MRRSGERVNRKFRAAAFNSLNHPSFNHPSEDNTEAGAGDERAPVPCAEDGSSSFETRA
jgi:hypothetical protein